MRCFSCHKFSIKAICDNCKDTILVPNITIRQLGSLDVISFFAYRDIEQFILSKFDYTGYRIYRYFAKSYIKPFLENFEKAIKDRCYLIAIDESIERGYSQSAILSHYGATKKIKPLHSLLIARNRVSYAGKDLSYRLANPRDFEYRGRGGIDVILVDDVVTTGLTLQEAYNTLSQAGVNLLFAITIADASL